MANEINLTQDRDGVLPDVTVEVNGDKTIGRVTDWTIKNQFFDTLEGTRIGKKTIVITIERAYK